MDTLNYIVNKYHLDLNVELPVQIPNMGRGNLAELFAELGFKIGAEIGTERGIYAEVLCRANPNAKLFCVDPWDTYQNYRTYITKDQVNGYYEDAKNRLSPFNCELIKKFSMDAVVDFADDSLDFVYIDGNHTFDSVTEDIYKWSRKVRKGGIVSGHDYVYRGGPSTHKVVQAINKYVQQYNIKPWFLVGTKAMLPGEIRDKMRSWFWVKP